MDKYIKEYLLEHQKVQVNDFGFFETVYKSAQIHPILHTLTVPGKYVVFSENSVADTTELTNFIASKENIAAEKANNRIAEWTKNVKDTINQKKEYPLPFGKFVINAMGKIEFIPSLDTDISPESFGLDAFTIPVKSTPKVSPQKPVETPVTKPVEPVAKPIVPLQEPVAPPQEIKEIIPEKSKELEKPDKPQKPKRKRRGLLIFLLSILFIVVGLGIACYLYPEVVKDYTEKLQSFVSKYKTDKVDKTDKTEPPVKEMEDTMQPNQLQEDTIKEEPKPAPIIREETILPMGNYYVIIGSFRSETNAQNFLNQRQNQYPNIVNLGKGQRSDLYMIGIGPYSEQDAESKRKEIPNTWVFKK
jgi:nucleoid DNA-binding protein/cell division septation protein DedD